jgi:membrane protease YdiL (CAAX protease family)
LWGPGLFEEIGWRGFALPYLQQRYSALTSSLIIGLVWALWHVPFFVGAIPFPWEDLVFFVPLVIVCSIIFTWVYNTTDGSLLAVILLHGAINSEQHLSGWHMLPDTAKTQILVDLPFVFIAVFLVWWFGTSNLSRSQRVRAPLCDTMKANSEIEPDTIVNSSVRCKATAL